MQIPHLINLLHGEMTAWRQDLHAHPELGFEEHRTSDFVAGKLAEFGWAWLAFSEPAMAHRSDCGLIWMRCRYTRPTTSHIGRSTTVACMRAATMATRPCCWAQRVTSLRHATSVAPCTSFFSPRSKESAVRKPCLKMGYANAPRVTREVPGPTSLHVSRRCGIIGDWSGCLQLRLSRTVPRTSTPIAGVHRVMRVE